MGGLRRWVQSPRSQKQRLEAERQARTAELCPAVYIKLGIVGEMPSAGYCESATIVCCPKHYKIGTLQHSHLRPWRNM